MKKSEMYSETMVQLAKLEAKVDVLLALFAEIKEEIDKGKPKEYVNPVHHFKDIIERSKKMQGGQIQGKSSCLWENMSEADKLKPMSMSCPCIKCSTYCLTRGSLTDPGFIQKWREPLNSNQDAEE